MAKEKSLLVLLLEKLRLTLRSNFHKQPENFPRANNNEIDVRPIAQPHLTVLPAFLASGYNWDFSFYFIFFFTILGFFFFSFQSALFRNPLRAHNLKSIKFMTLQTTHSLSLYFI